MGLFGGKDDTKQKIEELKAKMQQGGPGPQGGQQGWQPPQQPWQQQQEQYQAPQQSWQPQPQQEPPRVERRETMTSTYSHDDGDYDTGIILDLGDGMSLNLPIKSRMRLDEFLRIADRVRELKKIEHNQQY